jgi:hypothetical protein
MVRLSLVLAAARRLLLGIVLAGACTAHASLVTYAKTVDVSGSKSACDAIYCEVVAFHSLQFALPGPPTDEGLIQAVVTYDLALTSTFSFVNNWTDTVTTLLIGSNLNYTTGQITLLLGGPSGERLTAATPNFNMSTELDPGESITFGPNIVHLQGTTTLLMGDPLLDMISLSSILFYIDVIGDSFYDPCCVNDVLIPLTVEYAFSGSYSVAYLYTVPEPSALGLLTLLLVALAWFSSHGSASSGSLRPPSPWNRATLGL